MINLKEYQKAGTGFTILPLIPTFLLYKHNHILIAKYFIVSCLLIALTCFANRKIGEKIFKDCKKIGMKIGEIFSSTALFFVYIVALIPTGLAMKLVKRDRLKLKKVKSETYWKDISPQDNYENQF